MIYAYSDESVPAPDRIRALYPMEMRTLLDMGCGLSGPVNFGYLEQRGVNGLVVDVNFAADIAFAWPRVKADGAHLSFRDRSFDVVSSTEVMEHIPGPDQSLYLEELSRVAVRAAFVTTTNVAAHTGPGQEQAEARNHFQHYHFMPEPEFFLERGWTVTCWDGAHIEAHLLR